MPEQLDLAACTRPELAALVARLATSLVDDPPALAKDGAVIRTGLDATVDECRRLADGGKDEILAIEKREQASSGIREPFKVRYNRVFGYYIEVDEDPPREGAGELHPQADDRDPASSSSPPSSPSLERKVVAAEDTLAVREAELFRAEVVAAAAVAARVSAAGAALAVLDACGSLADVAARRSYCRPVVRRWRAACDRRRSRHPVIEAMLPPGTFACPTIAGSIPRRRAARHRHGPEHGGQVDIHARGRADRAARPDRQLPCLPHRRRSASATGQFTRVGAADDLSHAATSTFMVEMRETAAILAKATRRSLVVLDEVGRGTSTFDGVAIAWAVAEHLHDAIGARTLFATHYHELVALADGRPRVRNVHIAVREDDRRKEIVFLRRVVPGGASRSYGIDVARLAGLPDGVIGRARGILGQLESGGGPAAPARPRADLGRQLSLLGPADFGTIAVLGAARADRRRPYLTPLEALQLLAELKRPELSPGHPLGGPRFEARRQCSVSAATTSALVATVAWRAKTFSISTPWTSSSASAHASLATTRR